MLENETVDSSTSDAVNESSSGSPNTSQENNSAPSESQSAAAGAGKNENTPFHEHPRWKEMVEQRNEANKKYQDIEKKYSDIAKRLEDYEKRSQQQKTPEQEDKLLAEMKKINPDFAERFEKMQAALKKVEDFENRFKRLDSQDVQTRVVSTFQKFLSDNKVPQDLHRRYENELRAHAAQNPKLSINDIPSVLEAIHKEYTSFLDARTRTALQGYVKDKAKDASVPASVSQGKPVNPSREQKFSRDPDEARREMRAAVLAELKASKSS
jgi:seryl-tRNA synthetase